MAGKQWKAAGSFSARDARGKVHTIYVFDEWIEVSTLASAPHWQRSGLQRLSLADASHVNQIDDGSLQVVRTGERLHRV
ncbi:MAG: hypothetical protein RJA36_1859 [Pseudomonadota bacterium]|jgi:hypothetical protein